jgi:uncharacterized heparinase superfamily protein
VWFALQPRRVNGPIAVRCAQRTGPWQPPVATRRTHLGGGRFRLLGEEQEIRSASDWHRTDLEKLWLYNLHYFDDLRAADAPARRAEQRALLERWARENPPGSGIGWDPYPSSLRIANCVKWALAGGELGPELEQNLALQAELLSRRIEHHLQGNHLLANAKGLAFAGLFFAGDAAQRWLRTARALLERELDEQILADGGHCERSPMYHAIALEDVLDLINLARAQPAGAALDAPRLLEPRAQRMLEWLRRMLHPDGEIAFFNDAALEIAPRPDELCAYAARLGIPPSHGPLRELEPLAASGYVRARRGAATLIADVAEIGPAHLTGHAHADTLSFELSLGSRRVLVNSGTSRYGSGAERLRQRSTRAHNTVEIDGESSSEVWSGFRVGRRAHPFGLEMLETPQSIWLRCSHDGYRHRPGRPVHERRWSLCADALEVTDHIHGSFGRACASYHLAPGWEPEPAGAADRVRLRDARGGFLEASIDGGQARVEAATYHPRFSSALPSHVLRVDLNAAECTLRLDWSRLDARAVRD